MTRAVKVSRLWWSSVMLLAALSLFAAGCGDKKEEQKTSGDKKSEQSSQTQPQQIPEVKVVQVEASNIPVFKEYSASIQSKDSVEIRARVAGYLKERLFEEGSFVKEGQPLFTIDPREYEEDLNQAQSQLQRDKATLSMANKDLQRFGELYKAGAISRDEYDNKLTTVKEEEATVRQDEAAVKQAQLNLSYTSISAPISGLIGRAQAQVGDLVGRNDNTLLATITTVDPIYVNFSISEQDYLAYVKIAQERTQENQNRPEIKLLLKLADDVVYKYPGAINMVDPTVDKNTGTLGIRATFPNPDNLLREGQFARMMLALQANGKSILVPQRAVSDLQGMKICLVADKDGKVKSKTVQLGQEIESMVVITKGLEDGDLVLIEGLQKIKPGDTIKPEITQTNLKSLTDVFGTPPATGSQNATQGASEETLPLADADATHDAKDAQPAQADKQATQSDSAGGAQ